ncbi:MAG: XRE family transcriptional regulator [Mariprofundaceae bacterium]|nr:XRE family transcriptional regulator [Mariprofundaceae bacterium]
MSISQRLKEAMDGMSQYALAKESGIRQPTINRILGGNAPKFGTLEKIAAVLDVSALWLQNGKGNMRQVITTLSAADAADANVVPVTDKHGNLMKMRYLPVVSWVQAGEWGEAVDSYEPYDAEKWIAIVGNVGEHAFALKIEGDSMLPEFREGEYVAVDPAREVKNGSFVIAKLKDTNEATFKQFRLDTGRTYLKPLNSAYPIIDVTDNEQFHVCGVVIQKVMQYD